MNNLNQDTLEWFDLIDSLSNAERIEYRSILTGFGITELPRNLYYNYNTQEWI
jgi:hypothetical protein